MHVLLCPGLITKPNPNAAANPRPPRDCPRRLFHPCSYFQTKLNHVGPEWTAVQLFVSGSLAQESSIIFVYCDSLGNKWKLPLAFHPPFGGASC